MVTLLNDLGFTVIDFIICKPNADGNQLKRRILNAFIRMSHAAAAYAWTCGRDKPVKVGHSIVAFAGHGEEVNGELRLLIDRETWFTIPSTLYRLDGVIEPHLLVIYDNCHGY